MEEQQKLQKKYGLVTATAVIVGTVVGSGIFFRTDRLLGNTDGNIMLGLLAWIISGGIMFVCAYTFSMFAARYSKVNGLIDYSEALVGKRYSYFAGWFITVLYGPTFTAIIAWVAAGYTAQLFGIVGSHRILFISLVTLFYMLFIFVINFVSPKIAGKLQIGATVTKLIPLIVMGIIGMGIGLARGVNFTDLQVTSDITSMYKVSFFAGIVTTAYAYDGWACIASLNSEIKNSKRNMPLALIIGSLTIITVYIIYYLGVSFSGGSNDDNTFWGTVPTYKAIFGNVGATVLIVFIIISCLGAVNGNTLASNRAMYALGSKGQGPLPTITSRIDKRTDVPRVSAVIFITVSLFWLFINICSEMGWFGEYYFDIGDIASIGFYMISLPLFVMFIVKSKDLKWYKRFLLPILAILAASFMILALFLSDYKIALIYIATIILLMIIGRPFFRLKAMQDSDSSDTGNISSGSIDNTNSGNNSNSNDEGQATQGQ